MVEIMNATIAGRSLISLLTRQTYNPLSRKFNRDLKITISILMSAQAGPGPSSTAYLQAQKQNGNAANPNGPSSVLAPLGGMAEEQEPGVPNIFTDAQLEEFKEQDRYLPVSQAS
jgi:hypothetical protein